MEIPVGGLKPEDVAKLVQDVTGEPIQQGAATELYRATGGNALFVDRLLHSMNLLADPSSLSAGEPMTLPRSVLAAIRLRLQPLDPDTRRVLSACAILRRPSPLELLADVLEWDTERATTAVGSAIEAQLLESSEVGVGGYVLRHGVVRDGVLGELPATERMGLHAAVASALEKYALAEDKQRWARLATHYRASVPVAEHHRGKAIDCATRAGEQAMQELAYEQAVKHHLAALELSQGSAGKARLRILLGKAQLAAGQPDDARRNFEGASESARGEQSWSSLAEAAIGFAKTGEYGAHETRKAELLAEALSRAPEDDYALRARLQGRLAIEMWIDPVGLKRRGELSIAALGDARKSGDRRVIAFALVARLQASMGPAGLETRAALVRELLALPNLEPARRLEAVRWQLNMDYELGQIDAATDSLEAYARAASELRLPQLSYNTALRRCAEPLLRGRFAEARQSVDAAREAGLRAGDLHADAAWYGARAWLACLRGDLGAVAEWVPRLEASAEKLPALTFVQTGAVLYRLLLGKPVEGTPSFDRMQSMGPSDIPQNFLTMGALSTWRIFIVFGATMSRQLHFTRPICPTRIVCVSSGRIFPSGRWRVRWEGSRDLQRMMRQRSPTIAVLWISASARGLALG